MRVAEGLREGDHSGLGLGLGDRVGVGVHVALAERVGDGTDQVTVWVAV